MNRIQKLALYQLVVVLGSFGISAVLFGVLFYMYGISKAQWGFLGLLLLIFVHWGKVFFPQKPNKVEYDERDEKICNKAFRISFYIFWAFFIAGCLIPYVVVGPGKLITVDILMLVLFVTAIVLRLSYSICLLLLYRQGDINEQQ